MTPLRPQPEDDLARSLTEAVQSSALDEERENRFESETPIYDQLVRGSLRAWGPRGDLPDDR